MLRMLGSEAGGEAVDIKVDEAGNGPPDPRSLTREIWASQSQSEDCHLQGGTRNLRERRDRGELGVQLDLHGVPWRVYRLTRALLLLATIAVRQQTGTSLLHPHTTPMPLSYNWACLVVIDCPQPQSPQSLEYGPLFLA